MDKDSTKNELLKLLYNESSPNEAHALRSQMKNDEELSIEYEMLKAAKENLPNVLFNPSDSVVDKILAYSRKNAGVPQY